MEDYGTRENEYDTQEERDIRKKEYVNTNLLKDLAAAVEGKAAITTFACGGSVPVPDSSPNDPQASEQLPIPPISLRWCSETSPNSAKVTFPFSEDDQSSLAGLQKQLSDRHPAAFGFSGHDVLDESYRKASKLDTSTFSTNFHSHESEIVDAVQHVLFPSTIKGGQRIGIGPQIIRVELYKLSVHPLS